MRSDGPARLGVVAFTSGPLLPADRVFFERLAKDPLLDLRAVVVDERARAGEGLARRLFRGLRAEGWRWLAFALASALGGLSRTVSLALYEVMHWRLASDESYEALERTFGIPVHRVTDIHSEQSVCLIRSLGPQLGVIVGRSDLRPSVTSLPQYGTLEVHKGKGPGGGPVGYWEILGGETSIGVTVLYTTPQIDGGAVLSEASIPIEACDTLESLQIKADIVGATLAHEAIRGVARGDRRGVGEDASGGHTFPSPGDASVWRLRRRLRRQAARAMPILRTRPSTLVRMRLLVQYVLLLPLLLYLRRRLAMRGRAPICILFYHVVANRPVNHMCLPLDEFVKQIEFLRRHHAMVSLDDAVERLRTGRNDRLAASITFDDGYKDNAWAIEYLKYFGIPASFFVSIGHVRDGSGFEHDRRLGFDDAAPMSEPDLRRLSADGFLVGSHAVYHEDFGTVDPATADRLLRESRQAIGEVLGRAPEHFAFPKGHRGINITRKTFAAAKAHYRYIYSAYGGYNFPSRNRRHFLRVGHPMDVLELAMVMDGYVGFRQCVRGDAWGVKTDALPPY